MNTICNSLLALTTLLTLSASAQPSVGGWVSTEDGNKKLSEVEGLHFAAAPASDSVLEIDPAKTYQSILGLGGSFDHSTCDNLSKLPEAKRAEVIESLFSPTKGIGMNLMRVCIGASDFIGEPYYSYDDMPPGEMDLALSRFSIEKDRAYVLPAIKAAQANNPDLLFFASPWSPPGWMKTTGSMSGGKLRPEFYDAFARYLVKFLQAYQAEGVPIHALTLQNEPQMVDKNYPTTLWNGEEQRDFIRANFGPALRASGLPAQIWCWDHNWNQPEFPRAVMASPDAAQYVNGTAWHFYEGSVEAQTRFHEAFPQKDIFFSEGSTFGVKGAVEIIEILRSWARSYNAWVLMLDEHRKPNRGPHDASATCLELKDSGEVEYRFDYFMYGQFMKFIPRGAVRIASESRGLPKGLAHVAFLTTDGRMVLVVANTGKKEASINVACAQATAPATLLPRSVSTFIWKQQ